MTRVWVALQAMIPVAVLAVFFLLVAVSLGCGPSLDQVRDNLNEQRAVYDLEPVAADSCDELVAAFDGYTELVTNTIPVTDTDWETISTSECYTLQAHLRAFEKVCPETWPAIPQETAERCFQLTGE